MNAEEIKEGVKVKYIGIREAEYLRNKTLTIKSVRHEISEHQLIIRLVHTVRLVDIARIYTMDYFMENFRLETEEDKEGGYTLQPRIFNHTSYYNNARVYENANKNKKILVSYGVHVAGVVRNKPYVRLGILLSRMTTTHIADFFAQEGHLTLGMPSKIIELQSKYKKEDERLRKYMSTKSEIKDKHLEKLWDELTDVPFDENKDGEMVLSHKWYIFEKGTTRNEIWIWFSQHSKGIQYLLYERNSEKNAGISKGV